MPKLMTNLCLLIATSVISTCTVDNVMGDSLSESLGQLDFKNTGTVSRYMDFKKFDQQCFYMETDDEWLTRRKFDYLYQLRDGQKVAPPSGMRSSVPLGGLGAGTVELRADGRLMDWNIFNNAPANNDPIDAACLFNLPNYIGGTWRQADGLVLSNDD